MENRQTMESIVEAAKNKKVNILSLLGLQPWLIRSLTETDLEQFLNSMQKTMGKICHEDLLIHREDLSEEQKRQYREFYSTLTNGVDELLRDRWYLRDQLKRFKSDDAYDDLQSELHAKERKIQQIKKIGEDERIKLRNESRRALEARQNEHTEEKKALYDKIKSLETTVNIYRDERDIHKNRAETLSARLRGSSEKQLNAAIYNSQELLLRSDILFISKDTHLQLDYVQMGNPMDETLQILNAFLARKISGQYEEEGQKVMQRICNQEIKRTTEQKGFHLHRWRYRIGNIHGSNFFGTDEYLQILKQKVSKNSEEKPKGPPETIEKRTVSEQNFGSLILGTLSYHAMKQAYFALESERNTKIRDVLGLRRRIPDAIEERASEIVPYLTPVILPYTPILIREEKGEKVGRKFFPKYRWVIATKIPHP